MKKMKEFKYFSIFNHKKEEEYLREKHKMGWKFVRVTGFGMYHFEECEPEDVVYQLDYNPKKKSEKDEYLKMFDDCGWEYIQDYAGYTYFRKPLAQMDGDEEIFNDDESRIAMMGRVYKGRLFPLVSIFFACIVPQLILSVINKHYVIATVYSGLLLVYLALFLVSAISYNKMKK